MTRIIPAYPDIVDGAVPDKPVEVDDSQARQFVADGLARYPDNKTKKKEQG